ncbi:MAG: nickel-dependent hydrogenase large subunit [Comamonadaceae bacterium]|nr:nickel-dependent hydrogenase large subunit [Comamonadaceae bacterium]
MVQRLCGICPVSHHLAASKALDRDRRRDAAARRGAEKIRRLMHYGQMLQSHALHFFHLSLAGPAVRLRLRGRERATSSAWPQAHPDIAKQGVLLRKFGQEVIRVTAGKRVHGTGSVPGRREQAR